jgi:hypothetical protein
MLYCNVINNEILTAPRPLPGYIAEVNAAINNWYPVVFSNMPHHIESECNKITQLIKLTLNFDGTVVIGTHVIENKFQSEIDATRALLMSVLKEERNKKLLLSDWTQLPNAYGLTYNDKIAWETYRTQLRNLPETVDLNNIIWPTPP